MKSNSFVFFLFYLQIKRYEKLETIEDRRKLAREIYDNFIMKELLSHTHVIMILHGPYYLTYVLPSNFVRCFPGTPSRLSFTNLNSLD